MTHSSRLVYALLLSTLAACGGKSFDADQPRNTGGTDAGGSGHGGTGAGTGGNGSSKGGDAGSFNGAGTAGLSAGGSGAGGSGTSCSAFDDSPGTQVNVAIINRTAATIYLGPSTMTCGVEPVFDVRNGGGPLSFPDSCETSCQELRTTGTTGCPSICLLPSATALSPGETLHLSWNGLFDIAQQLPQGCVVDNSDGACRQTLQVQPGDYVFLAVAGHDLDCSQTTGGPCEACTPNDQGGCVTSAVVTGPMIQTKTSVVLGPAYGVYGSAPPPAPPAKEGGNAGGAIAYAIVELVFTD